MKKIDLSNRSQVIELLAQNKVWTKKHLGQNLLVDAEKLSKIIEAADLKSDDLVIEVGAGVGTLTLELAKKAKQVIAMDIDQNLLAILRRNCYGQNNIKIINQNVLTSNIAELTKLRRFNRGQSPARGQSPYKVIANLPYYITAPTIRYFLENENKPELMVLMVQKEVAERICAKPGEMSLLALSVMFYGRPEIVAQVPKESFFPTPKVDSAILKIAVIRNEKGEMRHEKEEMRKSDHVSHLSSHISNIGDVKLFFRIAKAGFHEKRKQLHNSLAHGLHLEDDQIKLILEKADIKPDIRAEDLGMEEWGKIYKIMKNEKLIMNKN